MELLSRAHRTSLPGNVNMPVTAGGSNPKTGDKMPRTLVERWREDFWGQVLDQFLHLTLIGAPPVAILLGLHGAGFPGWQIVGGALAAFWVASVREVEQRPVGSWGDLLVDVAFSTLGGGLVGLVFMVTE